MAKGARSHGLGPISVIQVNNQKVQGEKVQCSVLISILRKR